MVSSSQTIFSYIQSMPEGVCILRQWMKNHFLRINGAIIIASYLLTTLALIYQEPLYGIFGETNYLAIHVLMEIFIVVVSFTIAIQAWMMFPHVLSSYRLWLGALFVSIGLLEVLHLMSYKGMPNFITESSPYKATWFYIVARVTQALGLLVIIATKDKQISSKWRWIAYFAGIVYAYLWSFLIFHPSQILPQLVIDGVGTTVLKNSLQYTAIILQVFCIVLLIKKLNRNMKETLNIMLLVASVYLIIGDSMFTSYKSVYDISNFMGHVFQLTGYYFLMRAFYQTSVEEPFQKQKEAQFQLRYIAYHDELTKLPNGRFLKEKLQEELEKRPEQKKAVMLLDIDRFKTINESLGHSFGDLVLKGVAQRLQQILPSNLVITRLGGDEYTILLPMVEHEEDIVAICKQIQNVMNQPFQIQHLTLNVTFNIGISLYPDHGQDETELIKRSHIAMNEARKEVHRFKFFHRDMDKQLLKNLVLEQDLHKAIVNGELFVMYQPQVDLRTGKILALEALVRWKHPKRGLISPAEFIPIAEATGLIIPIGEYVLKESCMQLKEWHRNGLPPIGVSVNLSTRQFFQQNIVEIVENILIESELSPHYLELEITESMTMDVKNAISVLQDFKKLGVNIAVDDFGTGYSSLHYLRDLPIDRLKIDQSFVQDVMDDKKEAAIISMIISIAKHLQIEVIAEGVEHMEQLQFLKKQGCSQIQGYFFSKPLSAKDIRLQFQAIENQAIILR